MDSTIAKDVPIGVKREIFQPISTVQYIPLRIQFSAQQLLKLPPWPAAWFRETFAKSMKSLCCRNPIRCKGVCERPLECAYGLIVETPADTKEAQDAPRPFALYTPHEGPAIIEPEQPLTLEITLWGKAIELYPLLFIAWRDMGKRRKEEEGVDYTLLLEAVYQINSNELLYQYPSDEFTVPTPAQMNIHSHFTPTVSIELVTPLRMISNLRLVRSHMPPQTIVIAFFKNLIRKVLSLTPNLPIQSIEAELLQLVAQVEIQQFQCDWKHVSWYSRQQKRVLNMGGLIGSFTLSNLTPILVQLLTLGEFLHIGKNTTFGLGKYRLQRG
ncbi:MAG: CRISPR system precrRNA processing endoribonuclease RAMP protein Cas6 [bacterium]|nr:CRISPR system precrRNA processing endoribonuclease RAMP protein Cas6 [bacterium]